VCESFSVLVEKSREEGYVVIRIGWPTELPQQLFLNLAHLQVPYIICKAKEMI